MENIYLVGSEDVRKAARQIQAAAEEMSRAANSIDAAFERHQRFIDDWLDRFAAATPPKGEPDAK